MYALARHARSRHLRGAGDGDVRRDGARRIHGGRRVPLPPPRPAGAPYADRNEMAHRLIVGCRAGRHPAHAARHLLPPRGRSARRVERVQARFSDGIGRSAGSTASAPSTATTVVPHRRGNPLGAHRRPGVDAGRRDVGGGSRLPACTPTSPSSPTENAECLGAYGVTPVGVLDSAGALSERFTAVHATHVDGDRHRDAGAAVGRGVASARRPNASSPTGSGRPLRSATPGSRCASAPTPTP